MASAAVTKKFLGAFFGINRPVLRLVSQQIAVVHTKPFTKLNRFYFHKCSRPETLIVVWRIGCHLH